MDIGKSKAVDIYDFSYKWLSRKNVNLCSLSYWCVSYSFSLEFKDQILCLKNEHMYK